MTRADIGETIGDSNPEEENATAKGTNKGETEMVDKPLLENFMEMADDNDDDGRTLDDTNNGALDAEIKKVGEILNKSNFHQESRKEENGLIPNAEKENTQDESLKNVPIDRGWAWVILFGKTFRIS